MEGSKLAEWLALESRTDADLLVELRRAWRGTIDVQDALWWHAHPLTSTPDGKRDPASELAPLRAAVYSRAAAAEPVLETTDPSTGVTIRSTAPERELQAALRRQAENADALAELLERFRFGPPAAPPTEPAIEPTDAGSTDHDNVPHRLRGHRSVPPRRARDILLLAAGAAAGISGILGAQVLMHAPMASDAAPTSSASVSPPAPSKEPVDAVFRGTPTDMGSDIASGWVMIPPDAEPPNPFWIFDEPAIHRSPGEVPDLGPDIVPSSIRLMASTEQYAVFVAQNRADEYCLIVADGKRVSWVSGCNDADDIRSSGLWINAPVANPDNSGASTDFVATWGADGTFRFEPSASVVR